jgi:hypothetical protein
VADERATARRGTDGGRAIGPANRGVPDAGTPPGRPSGPGPGGSGGTPDAGTVPNTTLLVHFFFDEPPERNLLCPEPKTGHWRKAIRVASFDDVVQAVSKTAATAQVLDLGILVKGSSARLYVGKDTVDLTDFQEFRNGFTDIDRHLEPGGEVVILGCDCGADKDGSVFLKELSKLMPTRRIVGFNVVQDVGPAVPPTTCWEPRISTTPYRDHGGRPDGDAISTSKHAKVAQGGRIIQWPFDEDGEKNPKRFDGELTDRDMKKRWGIKPKPPQGPAKKKVPKP